MSQKNNRNGIESTRETLRERIIEALTESAPHLMKTNELSKKLGISAESEDYELVRELLEELQDENVIFRGPRRRYGRVVPNTSIQGEIRMVESGRWVLIPEEGTEPVIRFGNEDVWTAFHGDIVKARPLSFSDPEEIPWGEVTRVVERRTKTIVGTLRQGRELYLQPDSRKIHKTITVQRRYVDGARVGDKVVVELFEWNDPTHDPTGKVVDRLGRAGEMSAEIASIMERFDIPQEFPQEVLAEADAFPSVLTDADLEDRRDLREWDIFTIDPYDARDFDDAISIRRHDNGDITLGIHIADVGHYVREGSELDREAFQRGTSIYLVTGVIPMLPERLSNDLCSLRPDEDRLAYSVLARLSPRGTIREYEIVKSVIRSKRRFSYEEALEILESGEGDYADDLRDINKMAHVLRTKRHAKGSTDFTTTELKFRLDDDGIPIEVIPKKATESTKLIEDCMLLANRIVAEHIGKFKHLARRKKGSDLNPFIYRIHDVPPKNKLIDLSNFVKQFGYSVPVDNIQPKDIQKLVEAARKNDQEDLITDVTLRSMAKAVYAEYNIGHFGLAFSYYTHFTSPIRRYPDLIVHRLLHEYAQGMSGERAKEHLSRIGWVADHSSQRERLATDAERASIKRAEVEYLSNHVGDVFEAIIANILPFGMFAELRGLGIQGLIPTRTLEGDSYRYNERRKELVGRNTNRRYRTGDCVHVRVIKVDPINAEIDLGLIEEDEFHRATREDDAPKRNGHHKRGVGSFNASSSRSDDRRKGGRKEKGGKASRKEKASPKGGKKGKRKKS